MGKDGHQTGKEGPKRAKKGPERANRGPENGLKREAFHRVWRKGSCGCWGAGVKLATPVQCCVK